LRFVPRCESFYGQATLKRKIAPFLVMSCFPTIHSGLCFLVGIKLCRGRKRKGGHIGRRLKPKRSRNRHVDGVLRKFPRDRVGCCHCLLLGDEGKDTFAASGRTRRIGRPGLHSQRKFLLGATAWLRCQRGQFPSGSKDRLT